MANMQIAIVASEFNADITYLMLEVAKEHAKFLGATVSKVVKAPGSYDMPLLIKALLERSDIDGIVTLGAVIKGETKHDEVVVAQVSRKITDLSIQYNKPVSLGIIGPGVTAIQAKQRLETYSKRAVEAVIKMLKALTEINT